MPKGQQLPQLLTALSYHSPPWEVQGRTHTRRTEAKATRRMSGKGGQLSSRRLWEARAEGSLGLRLVPCVLPESVNMSRC